MGDVVSPALEGNGGTPFCVFVVDVVVAEAVEVPVEVAALDGSSIPL